MYRKDSNVIVWNDLVLTLTVQMSFIELSCISLMFSTKKGAVPSDDICNEKQIIKIN